MDTQRKKKYFVHIYGCQMNVSDAERLRSLLERVGFSPAANEHEADLIGVVACSVRQAPIDRIYGQAAKWQALKKTRAVVTLLTGCVLNHDREKMAGLFDLQFPIKDLRNLPALLTKHFDEDFTARVPVLDEYFDIVPNYSSSHCAYVPISSGCNKFCTYCAVPYTRGREISRPPNSIIDEIQRLINRGYKEITLLGQNVNSYGLDFEGIALNLPRRKVLKFRTNAVGELEVAKRPVENPMSFPQLLRTIDAIPGDCWIRFLTSHPYDMSDKLIDAVANGKKLTRFIHLPAQSGSNETLKRMNRLYTIEHYRERLQRVREAMPDAYLTTDIIAGFCGETEKEFEQTRRLMEAARYDMAFISPYSTRPGTAAARMTDDVPREEKDRRVSLLNDVLRQTAFERNQSVVGKSDRMLVEEYRKGTNIGRLKNGRKAHLRGEERTGEFVNVTVTEATPWHVACKPLNIRRRGRSSSPLAGTVHESAPL
jgi:tRNA-2-methylthio-N6-dimethylallyladenosine synthase